MQGISWADWFQNNGDICISYAPQNLRMEYAWFTSEKHGILENILPFSEIFMPRVIIYGLFWELKYTTKENTL